MKRYYVCPVIGDGTEDNPYRLAIQDYPDTPFEAGEIPVDMNSASANYGKPLHKFGLILVAARHHGKLISDNRMKPLPQVDLDVKLSSVHTATKNQMVADLKSIGIDTAFIAGTDGYREVIRAIGRITNPDFDENSFDVNE